MKHFAPAEFWQAYQRLPKSVQKLADKNFQLLKQDPCHPSLALKKLDDCGPFVWVFMIEH